MLQKLIFIMIVGSIQNLTNEEFEKSIERVKENLSEDLEEGQTPVLIHGYMDIPSLEFKGWDTTKRKLLDKEFPHQIPFFVDGAPDREYLDRLTYHLSIENCYVLTEPNANVRIEIENGCPTNIIKLYETSESN